MVSLPPPAQMTSPPSVPEMVSAFAVPVMVQVGAGGAAVVKVQLWSCASALPAGSFAPPEPPVIRAV